MSISKKDVKLLLALLGVLAAVAVFFLVYQPLTEKTETMKVENTELQARIAELEDKVAKKEFYESETVRFNTEAAAIFNEFPSNVIAEDVITYAIVEEATAPLDVSGLAIDPQEILYTLSQNAAVTGGEDAGTSISLVKQPTSLTYNASYEAFKRSIKYVCENPNRMTIESVAAAYDNTTGFLSGAADVNMYYLSGTGKPYTAPSLAGVPMGTKNPFGTVDAPVAAENDGVDETNETQESGN